MLAQEKRLAMVFDLDRQVRIDAIAVLAEHLERFVKRWLMDDQQADHADIRQLAKFGHAKAKGHAT